MRSSASSQTKLAAEAEVRRMSEVDGVDGVTLRPATVYGPRSTAVIGEIARAMRNGSMLLVDRGRPVAGLCYVDNLEGRTDGVRDPERHAPSNLRARHLSWCAVSVERAAHEDVGC